MHLKKLKTFAAFLLFFAFTFFTTQAQTIYTCSYTQACSWNSVTEKYDNCIGGTANTRFEIDKNEKSITQTIQDIKSTFPILSKQRKNKVTSVYMVKQPNGENYYYIIDSKTKEVRILVKKDGIASLTIYSQSDSSYNSD